MNPISEKTRTISAVLTIIALSGVGLSLLVICGIQSLHLADDNYQTFKSQHPDTPIKRTIPFSLVTADPRADIAEFDMAFTTDDVFSADNPIHMDIQVSLNNPQVNRIFVLGSLEPIDTSLINVKNIDHVIATYSKSDNGFQLNKTSVNSFTGSKNITPHSDGKLFFVAYVITN